MNHASIISIEREIIKMACQKTYSVTHHNVEFCILSIGGPVTQRRIFISALRISALISPQNLA